MATYVEIASVTVGSGGASTIGFSSIPSTFTDIALVFSARRSVDAADFLVSFEGVTTNLSSRELRGNGATATSVTNAADIKSFGLNNSGATANTFSNTEIYVPNYAGGANKSVSIDGVTEDNTSTAFTSMVAGLWASTAAITTITLSVASGNFVQYSTAYLYGIKKD